MNDWVNMGCSFESVARGDNRRRMVAERTYLLWTPCWEGMRVVGKCGEVVVVVMKVVSDVSVWVEPDLILCPVDDIATRETIFVDGGEEHLGGSDDDGNRVSIHSIVHHHHLDRMSTPPS
jgi:hypothetical protein